MVLERRPKPALETAALRIFSRPPIEIDDKIPLKNEHIILVPVPIIGYPNRVLKKWKGKEKVVVFV